MYTFIHIINKLTMYQFHIISFIKRNIKSIFINYTEILNYNFQLEKISSNNVKKEQNLILTELSNT